MLFCVQSEDILVAMRVQMCWGNSGMMCLATYQGMNPPYSPLSGGQGVQPHINTQTYLISLCQALAFDFGNNRPGPPSLLFSSLPPNLGGSRAGPHSAETFPN